MAAVAPCFSSLPVPPPLPLLDKEDPPPSRACSLSPLSLLPRPNPNPSAPVRRSAAAHHRHGRRRARPSRSKPKKPSSPPRRAAPPRAKNRSGRLGVDDAGRFPSARAAAVRPPTRRRPASPAHAVPSNTLLVSLPSSGTPPSSSSPSGPPRHRAPLPPPRHGRRRPCSGDHLVQCAAPLLLSASSTQWHQSPRPISILRDKSVINRGAAQ